MDAVDNGLGVVWAASRGLIGAGPDGTDSNATPNVGRPHAQARIAVVIVAAITINGAGRREAVNVATGAAA